MEREINTVFEAMAQAYHGFCLDLQEPLTKEQALLVYEALGRIEKWCIANGLTVADLEDAISPEIPF